MPEFNPVEFAEVFAHNAREAVEDLAGDGVANWLASRVDKEALIMAALYMCDNASGGDDENAARARMFEYVGWVMYAQIERNRIVDREVADND